MSRKHNTKHPDRSRSNYPRRLEARGLTKAPHLPDFDYLRRKQEREEWQEAHPWVAENRKRYQDHQ